jgi:hypothetical protein
MKRVLLDINVVLDILLNRLPWATDAGAIWNAHRQGTLDALLAGFTVPTIYYIVRKATDAATATQAVRDVLSTLLIVPVDRSTLLAALALTGPDFEDNLQTACAVQANADAIVTRDPRGFVGSPVPVLSPADVLSRLSGPPKP